MGKYAQLVMGPAGSGKSTYCNTIRLHCENSKRTVHCVNLDPAAEQFAYPVSIDIKELITVDEVMEELPYGPNGGLVYAMEFLNSNIEWFKDQLGDYEEDYLIIDCPGQIELYSHLDIMQNFVQTLQEIDYKVCGVYLLDSHFIEDSSKFISGMLMCLSAMIRLEIPHINILTKMDLRPNQEEDEQFVEKYLNPDFHALLTDLNQNTSKNFRKLNEAISSMLEDHNMVSFVTLDPTSEESITLALSHVDNAIQYGEDLDVNVKDYGNDENREEEDEEMDLF